jgi:hypothetical protein
MDHHAHMEGTTGTSARKDPPAGHGMLVIGLDTIFFYHLPMFMSPHDDQVVLEGTLSQQGSDPQRTYREDRKGHVNAGFGARELGSAAAADTTRAFLRRRAPVAGRTVLASPATWRWMS